MVAPCLATVAIIIFKNNIIITIITYNLPKITI